MWNGRGYTQSGQGHIFTGFYKTPPTLNMTTPTFYWAILISESCIPLILVSVWIKMLIVYSNVCLFYVLFSLQNVPLPHQSPLHIPSFLSLNFPNVFFQFLVPLILILIHHAAINSSYPLLPQFHSFLTLSLLCGPFLFLYTLPSLLSLVSPSSPPIISLFLLLVPLSSSLPLHLHPSLSSCSQKWQKKDVSDSSKTWICPAALTEATFQHRNCSFQ